jgi:para-aminobenzoate synthetase component I
LESLAADSQVHEHPIKLPAIVSLEEFAATLNKLGGQRIPFLFLVDFELQKPLVFPLHEIDGKKILFNINGFTNHAAETLPEGRIDFTKFPPPLPDYRKKFDRIRAHLCYGDSYLANLTIKTKVVTGMSLRDIFFLSRAKYKLLFENSFLVFSPETFVRISDSKIFAYPMKGTIDAAVSSAKEKILSDRKEMAEHVTIVDLIRNDLSAVAENVQVTRFRYVEEIKTIHKNLLQVSSEIQGDLANTHLNHLGDILVDLLPAGSVSGAPKCKTVEIIRAAENEPRGYYTGVVGIFDGQALDSGVMIRFIENEGGTFYYRSGGGITTQSIVETEYQEAIDKVYVPLN